MISIKNTILVTIMLLNLVSLSFGFNQIDNIIDKVYPNNQIYSSSHHKEIQDRIQIIKIDNAIKEKHNSREYKFLYIDNVKW